MKTTTILMSLIGMLAIRSAVVAEEKAQAKTLPDVLTACKDDCKKATTAAQAHECAEKKGRLNKQFRDTPCYKVNEEYEKAVGTGHKE